ncbi:replication protein A 70 kDa DNA-binding subunit A-like [Juglans microcarpa x Juglans regia]|uniref:replication protein A 70 kDa DNA-binding subunit A-like n=1 Tax=Juglans microcarpa x Juglans regia TaxID=2249226 RepID=UPI001B7E2943|nr:replication protein A 70 kDa DNA-binding subunit A-like [Juglans microcarpa x Juglans regia]
MAINLTEGAIMMMCRGELKAEEVKPVLQVIDVKQVSTQAQQHSNTERYRVLLSDGSHHQQGMLATQMNALVKEGKLQKGSVVQLTQFVCNVVQNRMIIIIVDLDMILEKMDLIGEPVSAPRNVAVQSSIAQPGMQIGNLSSFASSSPGGRASKPNMAEASMEHPRINQSHGNTYPTNSDSGRYAASNAPSMYPKAETSTGFPGSASLNGSYSGQNTNFHNPRPEALRPPLNTSTRQPQSGYQQPPPMYTNRGPVARNEAPPRIIPIAALNPYQGRWTIKARVTAKGELKHYNNPRGDGKVFSFDLLDSDGGEIRATCFNAVADQFYNQIEAGKVYLISKGSLKPAQKAFNHLQNDHEIFLESISIIQPCFEDDSTIPQQQFHFRPISDIEGMDSNSIVDVIGIVSSISPPASIMRKNGTETQRRILHLKDMSGRSVELTLWGNLVNAEGQRLQNMCDSGVFPILAVKAGRVNDFNGKALGTISTSQLFIEPNFPEAHRLKEWFDKEGRSIPSVSISRETSVGKTDSRKTISQIKDEKLGTSEKPDWITVSATISFVKVDNFCYTACPIMIGDRQCNKKVTNNGDGKWRCDRCDQSIEECDYRYILQFQIQDHTGLTWVTAFQECGEEIMGMPAKSLYYLKYEEQDDDKFGEIIRKVLFTKYIFKLKVKEETYSDEQRVKSTVVKAEKVDFASESRFLLDFMEKLKAGNYSSFATNTESISPNPGMSGTVVGNIGNRQPTPSMNYTGNSSNAGKDFSVPSHQAGRYGNQYNSSIAAAIGTPGSYPFCNSCGGTGHSSTNCPSIMSSPALGGSYPNRVSSGPGVGSSSGECFKCHQPGHWARDCPGLSTVPPAYGSSGVIPGRYGGASKQQFGGF